MKKHFSPTILVLFSLMLLSSCLKDDPANNETVYYGYQQIPNINEYMPQRLLEAFGDAHLYYGDEPPKIEGKYVINGYDCELNVIIDTLWRPRTGILPVTDYFNIYDQHKGIANYDFKRPYYADTQLTQLLFVEKSSIDTTYWSIDQGDHYQKFLDDSIAPSYFQNTYASKQDFKNIYIMGTDPYFTAYYYEVRHISSKTEPLLAVIMSGKVAKEYIIETDTANNVTDTIVSNVLQDLRIGYQSMMYYNKENILYPSLIANGSLPLPGNVWILKSLQDVHHGEFQQ